MENNQTEIDEALHVLEIELNRLFQFYEGSLDWSTMVYEFWDAKDILGHLVFWHESFARNLSDAAEGRKPNPLRGKLSEVNQQSVETTRTVSIPELIERMKKAQEVIRHHIYDDSVTLIPYKRGSRPYSRLEHLQIVAAHIRRHLKDLHKKFR